MGFKDFFMGKEKVENIYTPMIVLNEIDAALQSASVNSTKAKVENKKIKFPQELGEEHPFDFKLTEGIYRKFGFTTAVVDKYIDYIVGPGFYVTSKDERAKEIIEQFMKDINMDTLLRAWLKEALVTGNGFLEIGGMKDETPQGLKVLDSNYIYVKRDDKGKVEGYNQYVGGFDRFAPEQVIPFEPYEVSHLPFNKIGDDAYGYGIVYASLPTVNNVLASEGNAHMLLGRKANSPYHIKMGGVHGGKYYKPNAADVEAMGKKLEWLNNKHEWTTDGLTEIKVIDFGDIGDKFDSILKYDIEMLFYIYQVPAVLMGMSNISEGQAKTQMDGFERRITSMQIEIEKVIENDIFRRVLLSNGMDEHVEFEWGRPSTSEIYERMTKLTEVMKSPLISSSLTKLMEVDMVKMLGYDEDEYEVLSEEEEREREVQRKQAIVPGQNASPPPLVKPPKPPVPKPPRNNQSLHESCPHCDDIKEGQYNEITEWLGFNYKEYTNKIREVLKKEKFNMIAATTVVEAEAGYLTELQIKNLKNVLDKGFRDNLSMKEISNLINRKVKPKDLLKIDNDTIVTKADGTPFLIRGKEARSLSIARTEITRVANKGAAEHFKDGGVNKVRWVASAGLRTCPVCEGLNGLIYEVDGFPDLPQHTNCRCTIVPISELL